MTYTSVEICAGAGGQALGLDRAGFEHDKLVEIDKDACRTLRHNRPSWDVIETDLRDFNGHSLRGSVDLLAGGVPCPPFSVAGKQLGADDERDLFPEALRLVEEIKPRAVMLENVRGLSTAKFATYRTQVLDALATLGYATDWQLHFASDYGVPQLRPRFILIALRDDIIDGFQWPKPTAEQQTVGEVLGRLMAANGWPGALGWAARAAGIGPTLVGGSRKHGGPDLGPSRAREAWRRLHVDGRGVANDAPSVLDPDNHMPKLTTEMIALLQGFPEDWRFTGGKTARYRQIGNAFPPPVAEAIGRQVHRALRVADAGHSFGAELLRAV